ncbi:PepSY-associated TM helix domain-containing protein [Comamonas sp. GB3 AK4-5]|uniref:PepSY-associated TM helix domain-containing protein n=1 Tax=Comamonas sp. GB3 AK4-5 TaxID=3231487 RepID=UPI00351E7517
MEMTDNKKNAQAAAANQTGAGAGGFRQAQAWLHTWCGLWFSWLLFAVFLTGTLAVFEESITHWMTPEHHAEEAAQAQAPKGADLTQRLAWGLSYMAREHQGAEMWELWPADAQGGGRLTAYWFDGQREYAMQRLDNATGQPVDLPPSTVRQTLGGHHFVEFHHELHAGSWGLWIVGFATMAMLVALVSGIITHRRIFKDFFTFRSRKGQRSWLDAHNATGVLTLPFLFMIAFTGIVISGITFMPAPKISQYGLGEQAQQQFLRELDNPYLQQRSGEPLAVPDLEPFARKGQELMGQAVRAVVIYQPGESSARIGIYGWNSDAQATQRLSATSGMVMFSAATGEVLRVRLPGEVDGGVSSQAQSVMSGLHMVKFGGWAMKWLYFVCGLAGSALMATGSILFMVKRRSKHQGEFGAATARVYRLIEGLNVAAIAGLGVACIGYLWANRLVPVGIAHRDDWELAVFFGLWLLTLAHAQWVSPTVAWRQQLAALAALCLLLPLLSWLTMGKHLPAYMAEGDWESAGVELFCLASGLASVWALRGGRLGRKTTADKESRPACATQPADQAEAEVAA